MVFPFRKVLKVSYGLSQIVSEDSVPFLVVYHGYNKPTTSNNFLQHFVKEFEQLNTVGFTYENNVYYVKIKAIICDSPARSFVTCTKGHNDYFGCSKCIVEGDYENRRMLFLDHNSLRTDELFSIITSIFIKTQNIILEYLFLKKFHYQWFLLFRLIICIWYVLVK